MAYTPTLDDFKAATTAKKQESYNPSLDDFKQALSEPQDKPENMNEIGIQGGYGVEGNVYDALKKAGGVGASFIRSIANAPHYLSGGYIPTAIDPNFDFYKYLGTESNPLTDIAEIVTQYAPYGGGAAKAVAQLPRLVEKAPGLIKGIAKGISSKPTLSANVLGGAGYMAGTQEGNPIENAAIGAASGIVGSLIGKGVDKIITRPVASGIAEKSVKPLAKQAQKEIEKLPSPNQVARDFQESYKLSREANKSAWDDLSLKAKELDNIKSKLPNPTFNNKPYKDFVKKYSKEMSSKEPALRAPYDEALEFTDRAISLSPKSFEGAVQLRKNINAEMNKIARKHDLVKNKNFKDFGKQLKEKVAESVDRNIPAFAKKQGDEFKKAWEGANKAHQRQLKFYNTPGKLGSDTSNKQLREMLRQGDKAADGAVIKLFTPKTDQTGIAGYARLSELVGEKKAKEAIQSYMLRNIESSNADKAVALYRKLDPDQRNAIFKGSSMKKYLDTASKILGTIEKQGNAHYWGNHLLSLGLPGLLAGGGSYMLGASPELALGIGAGTALAGRSAIKGIGSAFGKNPKFAEAMRQRGIDGAKRQGNLSTAAISNYIGKQDDGKN
jgi:hypothetical protein